MAEVQRPTYKKMADYMAEMVENSSEVIKFIRRKMDDMEKKAKEMVHEMRIKSTA